MESILSLPNLKVPGRLGLVLGNPTKPLQISGFSEIPPISLPLPESLPDILQFKIQENFNVKDWVVQHAVQANKLLLPFTQILGVFTTSAEQVIENKQNSICTEIGELLKRVQKQVKSEELIHYHLDSSGKGKPMVKIYNFSNGKSGICGKIEERVWSNVELRAVVPVFLDFEEEVKDFSEVFREFSGFVEGLVVRFREIDGEGKLGKSQKALVYSKCIGKVLERPKLRFKGVIETRVIVPAGTKVDIAAGCIKKDLLKTIQDRFSIVKKNANNFKQTLNLPQRVFLVGENVTCDYLISGEADQQARERTKTLLGLSQGRYESIETQLPQSNSTLAPQKINSKAFNILAFIVLTVLFAIILKYLV